MKPPKPPRLPMCLCRNFGHWLLRIGSPSRVLTESIFPSCKESKQYFEDYRKYKIALLEYKIATRTCTRDEWRSYREYLYYKNLKG